MRFFVDDKLTEYPDTAAELREKILKDAKSERNKRPIAYFNDYFNHRGTLIHPLLGNLHQLIDELNKSRDFVEEPGENIVALVIQSRLSQLEKSTAPTASWF